MSPLRAALALVPLLASTATAAVTLTRGPYLQLLTTHSVTVVWKTSAAAECSLAIRRVDGAATVIYGPRASVCAIPVAGLEAGAHYAYVPRANGVALGSESIFQVDAPAFPFAFLVVGDSGGGTSAQTAVRDRMLATGADFILSTGDMVYEVGAAAAFDTQFFKPYRALLSRLVFWPCLGNHDVGTGRGQPWRDAFSTPANNVSGSENYYSFDFGNAHVAVIDSNAPVNPGSAQYLFLDQDLGVSEARWKFVAFHHSIYTDTPTTSVRKALVPLFDRHEVDIVFMGHVHAYERTKSLRDGKVVPDGAGTVYVTTGGGGRSLGSIAKTKLTARAEAAYHFTRVAVDGDVLLLQMIRHDGKVRDSLPLVKGLVTTTTTPTTSTTSTTLPDSALRFAPVADAFVDADSAGENFGTAKTMRVDGKPVRITYLRFAVSGVGDRVVSGATLRLTVDAGSGADGNGGGTVRGLADTTWNERTITYKTRPLVAGPVLATWGPVALKQVVTLDVGPAVVGNGGVGFALESTSSDYIGWVTREGTSGRPELVVTLASTTSTTTSTVASSTTSTTVPPGT